MCPIDRKADAVEIARVLQKLSEQEWLKGSREWWPKFVFHYTDVRNAVEILKYGKLLSRAELDKSRGMIVDNASQSVIARTDYQVRDFVRLYFRPKTPTQFRNEGIRPKNRRELESHCPVPVFFLFDSEEILTRADSEFSDGNLAVKGITALCKSADELAQFDFRKIYHVGTYQPHAEGIIKYHRNAEVVVPTEMDLSALRYIFCRSPAEKDTFLHLLPAEIFLKWNRRILLASKSQMFNCKWTFVETVELSSARVTINFSPDSKTPGPFDMEAVITDIDNNKEYHYKEHEFYAKTALRIAIPQGVERYIIKLVLDDSLAYINGFYGEDIPF